MSTAEPFPASCTSVRPQGRAVDYEHIYAGCAAKYEALIRAEDADKEIRRHLAKETGAYGGRVVDVGTGTGRLARLLYGNGRHLVCIDISPHMLAHARTLLGSDTKAQCSFAIADARSIPLASGSADLVVAGWVLGHFCEWEPQQWRTAIARAVTELLRIASLGSPVVILETLGLDVPAPRAPTDELAEYHSILERHYGFVPSVLRTDYSFPDVSQAADTLGWFFGPEYASRVQRQALTRITEWTGAWMQLAHAP